MAMIKAGYPILKSLEIDLRPDQERPPAGRSCIDVAGEVKTGQGPVGGLPALREAASPRSTRPA
ncbi:MAG: hypothetical protein MZV64_32770 [Ignavibacteriales bacterium]|nr:hypothetical protein [Ignavibacteriales bacterium]